MVDGSPFILKLRDNDRNVQNSPKSKISSFRNADRAGDFDIGLNMFAYQSRIDGLGKT